MKSLIKSLLVYSVLAAVLSAQAAIAQQPAPLQGFDDYVNNALKEWEVPGLAIAIVKDDKIVLAKGYGVRRLGESAAVDERTMFAIGSASKAFTAASLAMLTDEGKIKWDDAATKYLPSFQLYDAQVTREMTVRDLLSHRLGLERGDLMWYGGSYDRDEILRRVRHLRPSWSARSRFGYQNIMYVAAGQVVPAVTGKSWDDFTRERIFSPLGMTASNTSIRAFKSGDNVATPHAKFDNKVQPIEWRNIDNAGPAGSINSNVSEMTAWVRLQLNEGKFGGKQLLSTGAIKEMHMPQTIIRPEPPWTILFSEAHFINYGLGWFLHDYRGRKVVEHGGNIDGMSALVAMMPEEKLGLVILTNMNGTVLPSALKNKVFDLFLNAPARDWSAELRKSFRQLEQQAETVSKKMEEGRVKNTRPSLELSKYVGAYAHEMYGDAKVAQENGKLVFRYGAFVGDLEHWHYDTFMAHMRERHNGKALIKFDLNAEGKVGQVQLVIPAAGEVAFKRAPDKPEDVASVAMTEAEMSRYAGRYEMKAPPLEVNVEVVGGKLKGTIPGQPVATLVPVGPNRFRVVVEGAPGEIFAQFEMDGAKAKSMTIEQAGMKFTLMPKQ
jgi:CubicO group peptidase (beta-lactamase class C family)